MSQRVFETRWLIHSEQAAVRDKIPDNLTGIRSLTIKRALGSPKPQILEAVGF